MNKLILLLCFVAAAGAVADATLAPYSSAEPDDEECVTREFDAEFCAKPPVETDVQLGAYTGQWHQLYTTGDATRVSSNRCVTANYTLRADRTIGVLNCEQKPENAASKPTCVTGFAARRPDAAYDSELFVNFAGLPPGTYSVAALVGAAGYGYAGAAVYSCAARGGRLRPSLYILGRSPWMPHVVLEALVQKLTCMGYQVELEEFVAGMNPPECVYQKGAGSFEEVPIEPVFNIPSGAGPPPGVAGPPPGVAPM